MPLWLRTSAISEVCPPASTAVARSPVTGGPSASVRRMVRSTGSEATAATGLLPRPSGGAPAAPPPGAAGSLAVVPSPSAAAGSCAVGVSAVSPSVGPSACASSGLTAGWTVVGSQRRYSPQLEQKSRSSGLLVLQIAQTLTPS